MSLHSTVINKDTYFWGVGNLKTHELELNDLGMRHYQKRDGVYNSILAVKEELGFTKIIFEGAEVK